MPRSSRKKYNAEIDWKGYSGPVMLPICVRSPAVRGRNLQSTLSALTERAETVHLVMCDSLDRHNVGEAEAMRGADIWLAEHLPLVEARFGPVSVARWNAVRTDPAFADRHALLWALYAQSRAVKSVIDQIADFYLHAKAVRAHRDGLPFNENQERHRSALYLIEEFTGTSVYKDWYPGLPEAYWGVYVEDAGLFNRLNTLDRSVDLSLAETLPVSLNRLPAPVPGDAPRLAA